MQVAGQALEVAQHLEACSAQSARTNRLHARLPAMRMAGKVVCFQHHLAEARVTNRVELRLERPREPLPTWVSPAAGESYARQRLPKLAPKPQHAQLSLFD